MNSVDKEEIQNFSRHAEDWWDPTGPFRPLHMLGPLRMQYLRNQISTHTSHEPPTDLRPFEALRVLDVGCGGGLTAESLCRLGADVTAIDADAMAIETAKIHARENGLAITYINTSTEALLSSSKALAPFDLVIAFEIIEHVTDPASFLQSCADLTAKDGLCIFSTLNRTAKSFALGIMAAEYLLRWVPRGTHNWQKFIKPSEIVRMAEQAGLSPLNIDGYGYSPLKRQFFMTHDSVDINYFISLRKI